MKTKLALSLMLVLAYGFCSWTFGTAFEASKAPILGAISATQFEDSARPYVETAVASAVYGHADPFFWGWLLVLGFLVGLWRKNIQALFTSACVVALFMLPGNAMAYYDVRDLPEYVEIMPNQSAFLIPLTGASKENQASFMSESFLNANKVAMKRIQIPHTVLKTGLMEQDKYIPASRLLLVDRTPVTREWVSTSARGTGKGDEGFRFESSESINISTGIVLSAFVKEDDAAKFVYWFGTRAEKDQDNPAVKYASVMNGRSLSEVVDDNVRRKVQALLSREFGKLTLVEASAKKGEIIGIVEKEVKETFAAMGVTISFVGYAEGLSYDDNIQQAINNVFIAGKKAEEAKRLMDTVPYEQAMVGVTMVKAQATAVQTTASKWNGSLNLPSWVVLPEGLMKSVSGLFGKSDTPTVSK